ncbi:MAG: nicotinamide mononucleotide transporter [Paludibacteraceae bacterium]|nr:nicotinamide mononucleotide transporter [Paludibacteraceae bacterium]
MKKLLYKQLGKYSLVSLGIYLALFLILYSIELLIPSLAGELLQWQNPAFIVGIPASITGTAYVLTIRNPQNYTGFIAGIIMAILLAWQLALLQQWSLTILQLLVFIPFLTMSLIKWRRPIISKESNEDTSRLTILNTKYQLLNILVLIILTALDAKLITNFNESIIAYDLPLRLASGVMIGSSILANFWMIYKKLDSWIWWIVYNIAGIIFYSLIANIFSLILFLVFLIVNTQAGITWWKLYKQQQ